MAAKKRATVTKNSVIANSIEASVTTLMASLEKVDKAVAVSAAESKKLMTESRRLKKRRASLMGKKKRATAANKKNPTAVTRKAVKSISAELAKVTKELVKSTAARSAVIAELAGLKVSQKALSAYVKGIAAVDRKLAKPKKKTRRKKKAVKA
jgi:regulator of replication initiation timing